MKTLRLKKLSWALAFICFAVTLICSEIKTAQAFDGEACAAAITKFNNEVPPFLKENRNSAAVFREELKLITIPGGKYSVDLSRQEINQMTEATGLTKKEIEKAYKMIKKAEQLKESYERINRASSIMKIKLLRIKKRAQIVTAGCAE